MVSVDKIMTCLDGSSGSGLARDLHDEPSQGPMTSIKEAEPQWKALRGKTCAQCMHEGTRKTGRPETNFGVKFEGCLCVPHTLLKPLSFEEWQSE
ncbi:hypothetical protein H5410_029558 [Solanum commersonii]|uniref:Uncharacterized protein n=1 Tax=Solanum commersonii TaxID=4109 RepID=A0A9J5YG17_SOLCO|nr:hypothetical protein H5410_029558 [Solanum commersonii]